MFKKIQSVCMLASYFINIMKPSIISSHLEHIDDSYSILQRQKENRISVTLSLRGRFALPASRRYPSSVRWISRGNDKHEIRTALYISRGSSAFLDHSLVQSARFTATFNTSVSQDAARDRWKRAGSACVSKRMLTSRFALYISPIATPVSVAAANR